MSAAEARRADTSRDAIRAYLDAKAGTGASLGDVAEVAEITADSMQALFATIDRAVYRELREISNYITRMRSEISLLDAGEINSARLPSAGGHLGEIVQETEDATNAIMEAAEAMLNAPADDAAALKALVDDKVTAIFEACSFQDITGQRIARVVEILEHIEVRVACFAAAIDGGPDGGGVEDPRERRARELLLNGPQPRKTAVRQAEVDALMAATHA